MANYKSYQANRFTSENIAPSSICNNHLTTGVRNTYGTKWIYGDPGQCTPGCCCAWTVPNGVKVLKFEIWGAGGNGHGACSCNRCQHYMGAGGGTMNTVTICSAPGCVYTACAGGVYRCLSNECTACNGCTSYVNGYNLSNFCACGGGYGQSNGSWTDSCFSYMDSCYQAGQNGGHFASNTHMPAWIAAGPYTYPGDACHCWKHIGNTTSAFGLNTGRADQHIAECWIRCGCWTVPYGAGGMGAKTTYCGSCCGQGGTGGSGVVKITYY